MGRYDRSLFLLPCLILASALPARGEPTAPLPDGAVARLSGGHEGAVGAVAFSPDSRTLATAGADGTVRLWEARTGKALSRLARGLDGPKVLAFSPDGRTLLAGERTGRLRLWALPAGQEKDLPRGHDRAVLAAAFSPDGTELASCAWYDQIIHLRDLPGGADRRLLVGDSDPTSSFTALHFAAGGGRLLACTVVNRLTVWDVSTGTRRWEVAGQRRQASLYHSAAFSPNGRLWAAASVQHHAGVWDALTGKEVLEVRLAETTRRSWAVAFSGDGRLLALGGGDREGILQLCDIDAGEEVHTLEGFSGAVGALACSADGRLLATGAADGTVLVWDLAALAPPHRFAPPARDDLEPLWLALADADGHRVMLTLAASPRAVSFLQKRLHPASSPAPAGLDRLVRELDDERFEVRDRARQELGRVGPPAVAALRRALAGKPSLEVRRRVEQLLEELDRPAPGAEEMRVLRGVDALERIDSPEARRLLQTLTTGAPDAALTAEARAALRRLALRRPGP